MRRSFTLVETVILVASVGLVSLIGARAHRWMWSQAELWHFRMSVQEVATTMQSMRLRAVNARRTLTMRIDAPARRLQLMAVETGPLPQESVERTIWLPAGLEILQAPDHVTASPAGILSPVSMVIAAPAFQREFQLQAHPSGAVHLHEEPST